MARGVVAPTDEPIDRIRKNTRGLNYNSPTFMDLKLREEKSRNKQRLEQQREKEGSGRPGRREGE